MEELIGLYLPSSAEAAPSNPMKGRSGFLIELISNTYFRGKKSNFCIFLLENLDNSRFFCIFAAVLCVCALMHVHEERILRTRAEWELSIAWEIRMEVIGR